MSLIPSFFGNRSTVCDPFSLDFWDSPLQGFPFNTTSLISPSRRGWDSETSAFAHTRVDWKETPEAHVFEADLPGVNKEEVKVEVEDGHILQISGQRSKEEEEKNDTWHRVEEQRQLPEAVPAAGERQGGGGEGVHGERGAHRHRAQGGGEEARCQSHRDLWLRRR